MAPCEPRRVLFVTHAFLPDSHAGVEVYTARLARALADEHALSVAVVTARIRPGVPQYTVTHEHMDGLEVFGLVQNYPYRDLPEAIDDPLLDRIFGDVLDSFRPDILAVQTLSGLSIGFLEQAESRNIPIALHLHDGWLACPSGGQRLHPSGELCLPIDKRRCGRCFDEFRHREGPLERASHWIAQRLPDAVPPDTLHRAFHSMPEAGKILLKRWNDRVSRTPAERRDPSSPQLERARAEGAIDGRILARDQRIQSALRRVDLVLSPTRFLLDSLRRDGLDFPATVVLPTGVPESRPSVASSQGTAALQVLFLGTWVAHKGPQVLADALALLPSDLFEDGKLSAIGVGPSPFPLFQEQVVQRSRGRLCAKAAVPPEEVPELIDNCDVLVVPSTWAENAPLVVLEAQAAGKPVLASRLGGLKELITDGVDGLLFSPGNADELAQLLGRLANDRGQLARLQAGVRRPPTTKTLAQQVLEQYEQLLSPPAVASAAQAPRFSVVIPVLNGGERLLQLLEAVFSQTANGGVEVTVCDSGSTDGAVNEARSRYPSLRITHIAPEEYNHGLVRTRLVTEARSDLVALFSQDAVPLGQGYLEQLAEAFKEPDVAGAYARQIPRPGADPLVRANLERWTPSLPGETIRLSRLLPGETLETLIPIQQMERARFDNVGSMVRRSVILDCPFPARAFGEDLAWGAAVLQRGMSLAYVPSAQVEHHHDPTLREAFHRNFHAHRQAASEFGHLAVPSLRDAASAVVLGLPTDLASGPQWMVRGLPRRAMSLLGQWAGGRKGRKSRGQSLEL